MSDNDKRRTGRLGGFDLLAQEEADRAYRNVLEMRDRVFGDSPIEHLFFAALVVTAAHEHRQIVTISRFGDGIPGISRFYELEEAQDGEEVLGRPHMTAYIQKQVQIAGWRVDFVIHYPATPRRYDDRGHAVLTKLIVECDGHAFHERTKEQAARDRSRDRLAQLEGIPIFRFTGSEIWNDPAGCADEVLEFMERL